MASAVFRSAPRTRRPSIPNASASIPQQPGTPPPIGKALPPLPPHPQSQSQSRSPRSKRNTKANDAPRGHPDSPDVETMIKRTPRPRRISLATFHSNSPVARTRLATGSGVSVPSSWRGPGKAQGRDDDYESFVSNYGTLLDKDTSMDEKLLEGDGSESDSTNSPSAPARTGVATPLRLPQTAGMQGSSSVTRSTSKVESHDHAEPCRAEQHRASCPAWRRRSPSGAFPARAARWHTLRSLQRPARSRRPARARRSAAGRG